MFFSMCDGCSGHFIKLSYRVFSEILYKGLFRISRNSRHTSKNLKIFLSPGQIAVFCPLYSRGGERETGGSRANHCSDGMFVCAVIHICTELSKTNCHCGLIISAVQTYFKELVICRFCILVIQLLLPLVIGVIAYSPLCALGQILAGYYHYYGITDNGKSLSAFRYEVQKSLFKWLNRRSQRRSYFWDEFNQMMKEHPLLFSCLPHSKREVKNSKKKLRKKTKRA